MRELPLGPENRKLLTNRPDTFWQTALPRISQRLLQTRGGSYIVFVRNFHSDAQDLVLQRFLPSTRCSSRTSLLSASRDHVIVCPDR